MPVTETDVFGNPNIGVYCFCTESSAIVPPGLTRGKIRQFKNCLGVDVCESTIAGSTLIGALVAGNSRAILVPSTIHSHELDRIREFFPKVVEVDSRWTALGNIVLANDYGSVVHPHAPREIVDAVSVELESEPLLTGIGNLPFVGSLAIATNTGAISSSIASEAEAELIAQKLRVEVEPGTINGGRLFVRSGIVANSKGALVGPLTRGAELIQISRALKV